MSVNAIPTLTKIVRETFKAFDHIGDCLIRNIFWQGSRRRSCLHVIAFGDMSTIALPALDPLFGKLCDKMRNAVSCIALLHQTV